MLFNHGNNHKIITDEQRTTMLANAKRYDSDHDFDLTPIVRIFSPLGGATWLLCSVDRGDHPTSPKASRPGLWLPRDQLSLGHLCHSGNTSGTRSHPAKWHPSNFDTDRFRHATLPSWTTEGFATEPLFAPEPGGVPAAIGLSSILSRMTGLTGR